MNKRAGARRMSVQIGNSGTPEICDSAQVEPEQDCRMRKRQRKYRQTMDSLKVIRQQEPSDRGQNYG